MRPERRIGDFLRQRNRADHDHGRVALGGVDERVERRDPQPDEMRRRRQMRLVGHATARVVADRPRLEPRPKPGREVAGGPIVAGDDDRGLAGIAVQERGDQVRPERLRDERPPAVAGEQACLLVVVCMGEEDSEHPFSV